MSCVEHLRGHRVITAKVRWFDLNKGFGFAEVPDGSPDVFFHQSNVKGPLHALTEGTEVQLEVEGDKLKPKAKLVVIPHNSIERMRPAARSRPPSLFEWAHVPIRNFRDSNGETHTTVYHRLSALALPEDWRFQNSEDDDLPILRSYIFYTFLRLMREQKVAEFKRDNECWAAFNTGLVNNMYEPIFALFQKNVKGTKDWKLLDFCVPRDNKVGRTLVSYFNPLPEPAKYFENPADVVLNPDSEIHMSFQHVIRDGIARDRFPEEFLKQNLPASVTPGEFEYELSQNRETFLNYLADRIMMDDRVQRAIRNRIGDALDLAKKKARWNYKTAIPQYYPTRNEMSLLLPLALVSDTKVDIALIVNRLPVGSYEAPTVLPLDLAYNNARLVCRPDSDWLTPKTRSGSLNNLAN